MLRIGWSSQALKINSPYSSINEPLVKSPHLLGMNIENYPHKN